MRVDPLGAPVPDFNRPAWWCLAVGTATALLLLGRLLYFCGSGIDFTDEGYYLNWIAHSELYPASPTQFGFVYSVLYELMGQNLVLLRQANVLLTVACGWGFLGLVLLAQYRPARRERVACLALALILSVSGLTVFHHWLVTPNYNTLTLQGLLLGGCGLGLIWRDAGRESFRGYLVLGLAGGLTFLAKPSSAMAAAPLFLLCLASRRALTWRGLVTMALAALLLLAVAALLIDSSVARFCARLTGAAAKIGKLNQPFWDIFRLEAFPLTRGQHHALWIGAGIVGVMSWLAASSRRLLRLASVWLTLTSLAALLVTVGFFHYYRLPLLELCGIKVTPLFSYSSGEWTALYPYLGVLLLAWPVGALAALLPRFEQRPAWSEMGVAVCFLVMPYAYVFGTNTNYWSAMGGGAVFWCASGLMCLRASTGQRWPQVLPFAVTVLAGTIVILVPATEAPYRQRQPLTENTATVTVAGGNQLRVAADTAAYIRNVQALLDANKFKVGDPIVDLTGHYPALLHLVQAQPIGWAWLLGGYSGSEAFVRTALDRVPLQTLQRAWVLAEPNGPRALSPRLLGHYGLDLARDYEEVGTVDSPIADYSKSFKQHLYKPKLSPDGKAIPVR